jgi:HAD superfamily hydrolase (TIGR01509 family)
MKIDTLSRYSALLFDMNGVIVNDEHLHELAFAEVLSGLGYGMSHQDYARWFMGRTDRDGYQEFFASRRDNRRDIASLIDEKSHAYQRLARGNLSPYPGILDFIQRIAARTVPVALVTSSTRAEAAAVLDAFQLADIFGTRICADDINMGKPNPEGYLQGAAALGVESAMCIVIEDAPSGIRAAHSARMKCLAVTNTHDQMELMEAEVVVSELNDEAASALLQLYVPSTAKR